MVPHRFSVHHWNSGPITKPTHRGCNFRGMVDDSVHNRPINRWLLCMRFRPRCFCCCGKLTIVSFTGSSSVEISSSALRELSGTAISPSTGISSAIDTSDKPANWTHIHIHTSHTLSEYIYPQHVSGSSERPPWPEEKLLNRQFSFLNAW